MGMKWFSPLVGIAIAFLGHDATAKSRLTDPLKVARVCKNEAEQFCKGVRAGGKRIVTCLKAKAAELSPACLTALNSAE
jgi:Cysteine rich repeat